MVTANVCRAFARSPSAAKQRARGVPRCSIVIAPFESHGLRRLLLMNKPTFRNSQSEKRVQLQIAARNCATVFRQFWAGARFESDVPIVEHGWLRHCRDSVLDPHSNDLLGNRKSPVQSLACAPHLCIVRIAECTVQSPSRTTGCFDV